jgi:3-hydroxy acid dehydrogenase / malonic semialdehyde reductase
MNKIVFITGSSSGIGEACAEIFARHGDHIILNGRRTDRIQAVAERLLQKYGTKTYSANFDVRHRKDAEQAIQDLPSEWKNIDILVNNAGLALGLSPIHEGDPDQWDIMLDTNVKGILNVTRLISKKMVERGEGHIINISSVAGLQVYPNGNVYCATKHAVEALSKSMRIDLVPYGIKVTSISPGAVETEFSIVRFSGDIERAKKAYTTFTPLSATDIAEAVFFVADRPTNVNINELTIMPLAQANPYVTHKHSS